VESLASRDDVHRPPGQAAAAARAGRLHRSCPSAIVEGDASGGGEVDGACSSRYRLGRCRLQGRDTAQLVRAAVSLAGPGPPHVAADNPQAHSVPVRHYQRTRSPRSRSTRNNAPQTAEGEGSTASR